MEAARFRSWMSRYNLQSIVFCWIPLWAELLNRFIPLRNIRVCIHTRVYAWCNSELLLGLIFFPHRPFSPRILYFQFLDLIIPLWDESHGVRKNFPNLDQENSVEYVSLWSEILWWWRKYRSDNKKVKTKQGYWYELCKTAKFRTAKLSDLVKLCKTLPLFPPLDISCQNTFFTTFQNWQIDPFPPQYPWLSFNKKL